MRACLFFVMFIIMWLSAAAGNRVKLDREVAPFEQDELKQPLWNLDKRSTLDDHATVFTRMAAGVYYEWMPDRCRSYALLGDTLVYRGYNAGRYERMILENRAPSRAVYAAHGDELFSKFTARGLLYDRFHTRECGTLHASAPVAGHIVLGADTIAVVLQREDIVTTKYYDGDSTALEQRTVIHRWLRPGMIHPVAVQIETDSLPARLFSMWSLSDDNGENSSFLQRDEARDQEIMVVLESATATRTGDGLEISFSQHADTPFQVNVHLIDTAGNLYASGTLWSDGTCTLKLPTVWNGNLFVAVIYADNPQLSYKFFAGI